MENHIVYMGFKNVFNATTFQNETSWVTNSRGLRQRVKAAIQELQNMLASSSIATGHNSYCVMGKEFEYEGRRIRVVYERD